MQRKQFLSQLGLGAAFVLTAGCLGSCKKDTAAATDAAVDFNVDLTAAGSAALATNGGYIVQNNVVVARNNAGNYVAATVTCSHQSQNQITLNNNEWYCTAHGARFALTGGGLNSNGSNGLKIYNTALNGTTLRVFS
jgi:cytochrome b6-f complex iron-sulfur subunit